MQTGAAQLSCFAGEKEESDQLKGQEGRRMNLALPTHLPSAGAARSSSPLWLERGALWAGVEQGQVVQRRLRKL